jgi:hypothetical protein
VKAQVRNPHRLAVAVPFPTHFMLSVSLQVMSSQAFFCPFFHSRYLFSPRHFVFPLEISLSLSLSHVPRKLGAITGRSGEKQSMHAPIDPGAARDAEKVRPFLNCIFTRHP